MLINNYGINRYSETRKSQIQTPYSSVISFGNRLRLDSFQRKSIKKLTLKDIKSKAKTKSVQNDILEPYKIALNKFKQFSVEEYKTLSEQEKTILRAKYEKVFKKEEIPSDIEFLHDVASDDIKSHLDKKYGENRYKVIIIGRSLSSIGKVLGYKIGKENVINIPMSNAGKYTLTNNIITLFKNGEMEKFSQFLKKQGLEQDKIRNSQKHYVIMDYCCTGNSLNGAKKLLTNPFLLGNENISAIDVAKCIKSYGISTKFDTALKYCQFKDFAFVERSYNLSNADKSVINPTKADDKTKLVWFKLLDNQMTKQKPQKKPIKQTEPKKKSLLDTISYNIERKFLNPLITKLIKKICS